METAVKKKRRPRRGPFHADRCPVCNRMLKVVCKDPYTRECKDHGQWVDDGFFYIGETPE